MAAFEIVQSIPEKPLKGHPLYSSIKKLSGLSEGAIVKVELGSMAGRTASTRAHNWAKVNFAIRVSTALRGKDIYITKLA